MSKITIPKELFTKKNLAAVLYGKKDIRLETYPLPQTLEPNGNFSKTNLFRLLI